MFKNSVKFCNYLSDLWMNISCIKWVIYCLKSSVFSHYLSRFISKTLNSFTRNWIPPMLNLTHRLLHCIETPCTKFSDKSFPLQCCHLSSFKSKINNSASIQRSSYKLNNTFICIITDYRGHHRKGVSIYNAT